MLTVTINLLAVLVAAIVGHVLGAVWFSPKVFGKAWMEGSGNHPKPEDAHPKMGKLLAISFVGTLVMSYILAHFVDYVGATDAAGALSLAFWTWLGFFATSTLGSVLWDCKKSSWWWVMNGYYFVQLAIMSLILTLWT